MNHRLGHCIVASLVLPSVALADPVRGTLVDPNGKPISGARISGGMMSGPRSAVYERATTDKMGRFAFKTLPFVPAPEHPYNGMVLLPDGTLAHLMLRKPDAVVKLKGGDGALQVTVRDRQGAPLPQAEVKLDHFTPSERNGEVSSGSPDRAWTSYTVQKSDAQGVVRFRGLPKGDRVNYTVSRGGYRFGSYLLSPALGDAMEMVEAKGVRPVVIAGRVLRDGKPQPGVTVNVESVIEHNGTVSQIKTDADGRYRAADVLPGVCSVSVNSGGLSNRYVAKPILGISMTEGKERDGVDLSLVPGIPIKVRVVQREDDKPIAHANVSVDVDGASTQASALTSETGEVTVYVSPGRLYARVDRIGDRNLEGRQSYAIATIDGEHRPDIEIRVPAASLLPPIAHLSGTLRDTNGQPIAGAEVLSLSGSNGIARTDVTGRFTFTDPIDAGSVVIARKGGKITGKGATVLNEPSIGLTLDTESPSISGGAVDENGKPMANIEVTLGSTVGDFGEYRATRTDPEGKWSFEGLYPAAENYYVWIKREGYADETIQPIRVSPGERKAFPATQLSPRDGTVDGRLVDDAGNPVVGLTVSSQGRGGDTISDAKGEFHLTNVARGKLVIAIGDGRMMWQALDAHTGQTDLVVKVQPRPKDLLGVVSGDQTGKKLAKLNVAGWVQGGPVDLAAMGGKVTVIDLWATWCGPCVEGLPRMQKLYERYGKDGLVIVGVHSSSVEVDRAKVQAFLKSKGVTFPIAIDGKDAAGLSATHAQYGYKGIPHYLVVSRDGRIALDGDDDEAVEKAVERLLTEKSTGK